MSVILPSPGPGPAPRGSRIGPVSADNRQPDRQVVHRRPRQADLRHAGKPAMARQHGDAGPQHLLFRNRKSLRRGGEGRGRQAEHRARRQQVREPGPRLRPDHRRPEPVGLGECPRRARGCGRPSKAMRGLRRSSQSLKVSQASQGCKVRCAFAQAERPGGAIVTFSDAPTDPAEPFDRRPERVGDLVVRKAERIDGDQQPVRAAPPGPPPATARRRRARRSRRRARTSPSCRSSGAWAIMPRRSSRPQVGRMP